MVPGHSVNCFRIHYEDWGGGGGLRANLKLLYIDIGMYVYSNGTV